MLRRPETSATCLLKAAGRKEVHRFARDGMTEREFGGVQVHTVGALDAVEGVAENRTGETSGMGAMHAELMRATGFRIEVDKGSALVHLFCCVRNGSISINCHQLYYII